jgi:hypothetical protein
MEVISDDFEWDAPRQDGSAFTQGCGSGVEVEREGQSARAFVDATELAEETPTATPCGPMVNWVSASSFNIAMAWRAACSCW